jgi:general secretion pathway protein K
MNGGDARRGMILFTVLWAVAFCSVLALATSMTFRGLAGVVALDRERAQADALLGAGLEAGAGIVAAAGEAQLTEREAVITLSTGSVRVSLSDEGGRIDVGKAPVELLASLLRHVGADDEDAAGVASAIVDLRLHERPGVPSNPPRPADGKSDKTESTSLAAPFTDVRQLATVPGMRPEWLAEMIPLVTVYGNETVNPFTAQAAVIRALPSFDEARLEILLDLRKSPMVDAERLAFVMGPAEKYLKLVSKQVISVRLAARTANGYAAGAQAFIVVLPGDKQPYRVLAWTPQLPSADIDGSS